VQQSGSSDRDAFERLGLSIRSTFFRVSAFINALLDSDQWYRQGRRARRRLKYIGGAAAIGAALGFAFGDQFLKWLLVPANGQLSPFEGGPPVFTVPTDMLWLRLKIIFQASLVFAVPAFAASAYTMVSHWLPPGMRVFVKIYAPASVVLFALGILFVYYVMLETALGFLLNFGTDIAVALISVRDYYDMVSALLFYFGLIFQIPLIVYLLVKLNIVGYRKLKFARWYVWPALGFFAAIITPTIDPFNLALVFGPMVALYEVGLFLAWTVHPEDGNYLWIKTVWSAVMWVLRWPLVTLRKLSAFVANVLWRW